MVEIIVAVITLISSETGMYNSKFVLMETTLEECMKVTGAAVDDLLKEPLPGLDYDLALYNCAPLDDLSFVDVPPIGEQL